MVGREDRVKGENAEGGLGMHGKHQTTRGAHSGTKRPGIPQTEACRVHFNIRLVDGDQRHQTEQAEACFEHAGLDQIGSSLSPLIVLKLLTEL